MKAKKKQPVSRVRVKSEDVISTQEKTNKRGKTKSKETFTSKSSNTDLNTGEVSKSETRQVDKGRSKSGKSRTKTRFKQKFSVTDGDGKLLVKQVDKGRSGGVLGRKKTQRIRVTRAGRKAGYGKSMRKRFR